MPRKQKLITKEILKLLPPLYANEDKKPEETKVPLKLFNPVGRGTWYITEYSPEEDMGFGWCDLGEPELGYVSLAELRSVKLRFGLTIERDAHWDPNTTLAQVQKGEAS